MALHYTKNLLNFWRNNFSSNDFDILADIVDRCVSNQKINKIFTYQIN